MNEEIIINIKYYDSFGNENDFYDNIDKNINYDSMLFVIRFEVNNISSINSKNNNIGNIVISDTFLFENDKVLNLTIDVNYFNFWETRDEINKPINNIKEIYANNIFGNRIQEKCEFVNIYLPLKEKIEYLIDFPLVHANITLFENNFKFDSNKIGKFLLFFNEIEEISFYRKCDYPIVIINLKENKFFTKISSKILVVEFHGDSILKVFYPFKELLEDKFKIKEINEYPEILINSNTLNNFNVIPDDYKRFRFDYLDNDEFIDFVNLKNIINSYKCNYEKYSYDEIYELMFQEENIKRDPYVNKNNDILSLYLITGTLFSSKRNFFNEIKNFNLKLPIKNDIDLFFYEYEDKDLKTINNDNFFSKIQEFIKINNIKNGDIIFIVIPHFINHIEFVNNINNKNIENINFEVKSVCSKIKINNIFDKNKQIIENFKSYLLPGFCNFVYLETDKLNDDETENIYSFLKNNFWEVNFYLVNKRVLLKQLNDFILFNQYNTKRNIMIRYLSNLNLNFISNEEVVYLDYKQLIDKKTFIEWVKNELFHIKNGLLYKNKNTFELDNYEDYQYKKNIKVKIEDKLKNEIKKMKILIEPYRQMKKNKYPQISGITGIIRFEDELDSLYEFKCSKINFYLQKIESNIEVQQLDYKKPIYKSNNFDKIGILIYGKNLDIISLPKLLNKKITKIPILEKPWTFKQLTEKKIKDLEYEYSDFQNDDYIFDGYIFRDLYGKPLNQHPKRKLIWENYIKISNQEIDSANQKIKDELKNKRRFYNKN